MHNGQLSVCSGVWLDARYLNNEKAQARNLLKKLLADTFHEKGVHVSGGPHHEAGGQHPLGEKWDPHRFL